MIDDLLAAGPRAVTLMLTTRCNLRCAYCHQDRSRPRTMDTRVLEAALGLFLRSDHGRPTLTFFGGEPLLEIPLMRLAVEIVRTLKPPWMRPDLRLFTNGLLLDQETAAFLAESDVHVTLSIDGLSAAQDQRGPGTFSTLDGILVGLGHEYPERLRARISAALTLTSANVSHLADSFRYLLSRGMRDIGIVPVVTPDPGWGTEARSVLDRQLALVAEESRKILRRSGEVPFRPFRGDGREASAQSESDPLCGAGSRKSLFVDVDGSIAPCAAIARSCLQNPPPLLHEVLETYGEVLITDADLEMELREREAAIQRLPVLRGKSSKASSAGPCLACPVLRNCVVCPASIAWSDGDAPDPDRIPAIQCDFNRLVASHRVQFRSRVSGSGSRENIQ